ncbi:MAG: hypothetical protein LBO74_03780 [Candidatus Symbiothrix sp.]|jgi:hypothetical protein|nr:hypothetical protein [Candidatus Symbiothrix sp.]
MNKYKSMLVLGIALFAFSLSVNASLTMEKQSGFEQKRETKFVDRFSEALNGNNGNSGSLRSDDGWTDPRSDGDAGALGEPVGDGIGIILTIGLLYGIYVFKRKREEV